MVGNRLFQQDVHARPPTASRGRRTLPACVALLLTTLQILPAQDRLLPVLSFRKIEIPVTGSILSRIVRDERGLIWIGTFGALQRYDGYTSKIYQHSTDDPHSIASNDVRSLFLDSRHRLWLGTYETGISLYDAPHDRFVNFPPRLDDPLWPEGRRTVYAIKEDRTGNLWFGTTWGLVRARLPKDDPPLEADSLISAIAFQTYSLPSPLNEVYDLSLIGDTIMAVASDSGLLFFNLATCDFHRGEFSDPIAGPLNSDMIQCIGQGFKDQLWVGTTNSGAFMVDWQTNRVVNFRHSERDSQSIKSNTIQDIVLDSRNRIWASSPRGLDILDPASGGCIPHLDYPSGAPSILMSVDQEGVQWISAGGTLYCRTPKCERFPQWSFPAPDGSSKSFFTIDSDEEDKSWISAGRGILYQVDLSTKTLLRTIDLFRGKKPELIYPDRTNSLLEANGVYWYGTWGLGLLKVDLATGSVKSFEYDPAKGRSTIARSIAPGRGGVLWISADAFGLMKFDRVSEVFFPTNILNTATVMTDHRGRIWITTEGDGLLVYNPESGTQTKFLHNPADPSTLANNRTHMTFEDPLGRIWVTAGNVVHQWIDSTRSFRRYPTTTFTKATESFPLGLDQMGKLWISYRKWGVAVLDPATGSSMSYSPSDGIAGTINGMEVLHDGTVVLAGWWGLNIVHPESLETERPAPPFVLTRLSINDTPTVLPVHSGDLALSYNQNVLEFEFAAVDIDAPTFVQYRYQLEGLEQEWVTPANRRYVRYPGLSPGDYTFRVRAASTWNEWPEQEVSLAIHIAPPWWRTVWAYVLYSAIFLGMLYSIHRVKIRQVQLKQDAAVEHLRANHLAEMDQLKSRFFANISHEFRTPLTLILGPVQRWSEILSRPVAQDNKPPELGSPEANKALVRDLTLVQRNASRLLTLINQLLDLSRLDAGGMKLEAARGDIVPFVRGIANSFESSAGLRHITLEVHSPAEDIEVYFDRDALEKILTNLLSNAFKFTPDGGLVACTIERVSLPRDQAPSEGVAISISDTGTGIPPHERAKVFDRFCQVDASQTREYEGSGIGLALVKELVERHHGTIDVQSEVGRGTTFTVILPLGRVHLADDEIAKTVVELPRTTAETPARGETFLEEGLNEGQSEPGEPGGDGKPIILIIEDNADVRAYLKSYLLPTYTVVEARNGEEGIEKAVETVPDLIISDVMMPKKDGYEVCRTVKHDEKTSHIPVVLLTARASSEDKIGGLEIGADDYLVKPFEPKELTTRVGNLITLRRALRKRYSEAALLGPGAVDLPSIEEAFLHKVVAVVENHMGDEDFHIADLARELCMSRVQLHRKLIALANIPPWEFIRHFRLQRAMELLKKHVGTIAEIGYSVGFSDPSYFTRSFTKQFGITPTEFRKSADRSNSN